MRVSKPPQERRAELVAAARRLFDEKGVDKTRVSDIVKRVGVAQGVFYYYFKSKDEIVQQVVQEITGEMHDATQAILTDKSAGLCHQLARFIALFLDLADQFLGDEETSLAPLFEGGADTVPALQSARVVMDGLHALVRQAAEAGELAVPHPWESAQVLVYGLARLAAYHLPDAETLCSIVQHTLALPEGELYACYKRLGSFAGA